MLNMWRRAGIPVARGATVHEVDEARNFVDGVVLPVILKPADRHSMVGVRIVRQSDELSESYEHARAASTTQLVMIEEYVEGNLHDANGLFAGDKFYRASVAHKRAGLPPACIVERGECPTTLSEDEQDQMYEVVERRARAMELSHGPVKCDIIWGKDGPRLMEVAPRFHRKLRALYLIPLALGIDMYDLHFRYLSEGVVDEGALLPRPQGHVITRERTQEAATSLTKVVYQHLSFEYEK